MRTKGLARGLIAGAAAVAVLGSAVALGASAGIVTLPTQWRVQAPQGSVGTLGTLPTGLVLSRDGSRVIELETGYSKPTLRVLDAHTLAEVHAVKLGGAYGAPLRDANGDGVWVAIAGTFGEQIAHVDTERGAIDATVSLPTPFWPAAIAHSPDGTMAVAGDLANRIALIDPSTRTVSGTVDVGHHPAALLFADGGRTLYVADRGESSVDVVDVATRRVRARIAVGDHPVALASDGRHVYVADADDDDVAIVDPVRNRVVRRVRVPFAEDHVTGTSPDALTIAGDRLYVACGAANAVAVFRISGDRLQALGAIPTGWYPTGVAVDRTHAALYVLDGKGESGHTNAQYRPAGYAQLATGDSAAQYIARQLSGSVRRMAIPNAAELARGLADVRDLAQHEPAPANAIVRAGGPIRHVIYIIKENRSYDQVLGDISTADGDASLVLFGAKVTPNEHALANRFGVFDRFFEDAHVSADGHNWSTAAFANDYLERMWPPNYAGRRSLYDFEDSAEASRPKNGYLWDNAAAHAVSFRDYGEFVTAGAASTPVSASDPALRGRFDPMFPTFDMDITDASRFKEWQREFALYERSHTLPSLEIVRFPRDHTSGTKNGENTVQAMVADNDFAVGELVDTVSHSADWASTAIFVIEDDAQNGPDHVDEQRAPFYLISPYAAGGIQHGSYTQASVLRTMEILLGLPPMTPYDAGARPLDAAFRATPDLTPYDALPAQIDLGAKNGKTAPDAALSAVLDFRGEDRVDDATMNAVVWHAVRGAHATPPPYGLFPAGSMLRQAQHDRDAAQHDDAKDDDGD